MVGPSIVWSGLSVQATSLFNCYKRTSLIFLIRNTINWTINLQEYERTDKIRTDTICYFRFEIKSKTSGDCDFQFDCVI